MHSSHTKVTDTRIFGMLCAYSRTSMDHATKLALLDHFDLSADLPYLLKQLKHQLSLELHPCQQIKSPMHRVIHSSH